jgi:hypothetical protein
MQEVKHGRVHAVRDQLIDYLFRDARPLPSGVSSFYGAVRPFLVKLDSDVALTDGFISYFDELLSEFFDDRMNGHVSLPWESSGAELRPAGAVFSSR